MSTEARAQDTAATSAQMPPPPPAYSRPNSASDSSSASLTASGVRAPLGWSPPVGIDSAAASPKPPAEADVAAAERAAASAIAGAAEPSNGNAAVGMVPPPAAWAAIPAASAFGGMPGGGEPKPRPFPEPRTQPQPMPSDGQVQYSPNQTATMVLGAGTSNAGTASFALSPSTCAAPTNQPMVMAEPQPQPQPFGTGIVPGEQPTLARPPPTAAVAAGDPSMDVGFLPPSSSLPSGVAPAPASTAVAPATTAPVATMAPAPATATAPPATATSTLPPPNPPVVVPNLHQQPPPAAWQQLPQPPPPPPPAAMIAAHHQAAVIQQTAQMGRRGSESGAAIVLAPNGTAPSSSSPSSSSLSSSAAKAASAPRVAGTTGGMPPSNGYGFGGTVERSASPSSSRRPSVAGSATGTGGVGMEVVAGDGAGGPSLGDGTSAVGPNPYDPSDINANGNGNGNANPAPTAPTAPTADVGHNHGTANPTNNPSAQPLYRPSDDDWLSPQLCLVRQQMECFAADQRDINERRSAGGSIHPPAMGQVGIRCVHCTHTPLKARAKGSVLYPKSVKAIHMAMRNFQRHHLLACPAMPFNVKQRYAAIRNKAVQSKKDSYIYLAQSCKDMGVVEKGGLLQLGTQEDLSAFDPSAVARPAGGQNGPAAIHASAAAAAAAAAQAASVYGNGFPAANGLSMAMAGTSGTGEAKPAASSVRKLNVDNVKAASGLLSLFKKSTPVSMANAAALAARGGGPYGQTTAEQATAAAFAQGTIPPEYAQALAQRQQRKAQRNERLATSTFGSNPAVAGTFGAAMQGGLGPGLGPGALPGAVTMMNPSATMAMPPLPGGAPALGVGVPGPVSAQDIAAPDQYAAYLNSTKSALTPADLAARAEMDGPGSAAAAAAAAEVEISELRAQMDEQKRLEHYYFLQLQKQKADAAAAAATAAVEAAFPGPPAPGAPLPLPGQVPGVPAPPAFPAVSPGGDELLDAQQLAGIGAALDIDPATGALNISAAALANGGALDNVSASVKAGARRDYMQYLRSLNRMGTTIALAQRQASLLQSFPTNVSLQADYRATLGTMEEEMGSAKVQALRLKEYQLALNAETVVQTTHQTRAAELGASGMFGGGQA